MRAMLRLFLVLCLANWAALSWVGDADADTCADENGIVKDDGNCWRSIPPLQKYAIIRGIWIGKQLRSDTLEMSGESGSIWFGLDWASTPPETTIGDITEYFDRLYQTPANRKISWKNAYLLAALQARDDDENDRLALLTFLRSNDSIPTEGELVGVRSANVIMVKSGEKIYDVRVAGINVPQLISERTVQFLKGLMTGGFFSCDRTGPTPVSLYYGTELFDDQSRLAADIRIRASTRICIGGKAIKLGDGGFTNIGYFLITHGLAQPDTRVDPKWSDNRKSFFNDADENDARSAKLYLYGDATDPVVEVISGRLPPDSY